MVSPIHALCAATLLALLSAAPAALAQGQPDTDQDGVADGADDCRDVANPEQVDTNGDGFGNACDPDVDDNGVVNRRDFLLLQSMVGPHGGVGDLDGDGAVREGDFAVLQAFFGKPPGPGIEFVPRGTFYLHQGQVAQQPFTGPDAIVIDPPYVSSLSGCPPIEAQFRTQNVATQVEVVWPQCPGSNAPTYALLAVDKVSGTTLRGVLKQPDHQPVDIAATPDNGAGLRFATFNTQLLPSFKQGTTLEQTGRNLVERIKAADYDFIALNEMFDEDLQKIVRNGLASAYPYFVQYLDADDLEDSGLQIYSKLPFEALPNPVHMIPVDECIASGPLVEAGAGPAGIVYNRDCEKVAFLEFDDCTSDDCFASKGVALVRLREPASGFVHNVLFTHMQASYTPAKYPSELASPFAAFVQFDTRMKQLRDIHDLLLDTIGQARFDSEETFLLGDLNIDGDLADPTIEDFGGLNVENLWEWRLAFATPGSFFTDQLFDSWANETAPKDPSGSYDRGITNVTAWAAAGGGRLDYVLRKRWQRGCAQHMTLAHNLRWREPYTETGIGPQGVGLGGVEDLSDHYGLNMDYNFGMPRCSPAIAEVVAAPLGQIVSRNETLGLPGQIAWYRFEEPGTYSFELADGGAGSTFRVYEATDMSTPVPQYKEEETVLAFGGRVFFHGKQFRISKAPFYVRVYHPDRTRHDVAYSLRALRHDCSSRELACALKPGEKRAQTLPANPVGGAGNEAWFELYTEGTPDFLEQQLRFAASDIGPAAQSAFHLAVLDAGGVPIAGDELAEATASDGYLLQTDLSETIKRKLFLRVTRDMGGAPPPYAPDFNAFSVRWETDLTIFFGSANGGQSLQLRCLAENDGFDLDGDDEMVFASATVNGVNVLDPPIEYIIGEFDDGSQASLEGIMSPPIYYTGAAQLVLHLYEDDDFAAGDNDEWDYAIPPLEPGVAGPQPRDVSFAPGGAGLYQLRYNLTHGFDR